MSLQAVFLPMFVMVALTFVLLFWMGRVRILAVTSGEVHQRDIALREPNWPPRVTQISNAFHNQLELPLLFYVLTILAWITKHADIFFVVMAWLFVAGRLIHAYVHVTSNRVAHRGQIYVVSAAVLVLMWAIFMGRILLGVG